MTQPASRRYAIVILTGGSSLCLPVLQRTLADEAVEVRGIVIDTQTSVSRSKLDVLRRYVRYNGIRKTVSHLASLMLKTVRRTSAVSADHFSMKELEDFAAQNRIPVNYVDGINSEDSVNTIRQCRAKLGVVLGTRILDHRIFEIPEDGMINVHQAKVPFYRGSACTFWALYNDEKEVGVTIHEVVRKVDAGAVILQECLPMAYDFSRYGLRFDDFIRDVHRELDVLCVNLLCRALHVIARGQSKRRPVDLTLGKRYRHPTHSEKKQLLRLLRSRQRVAESTS